MTTKPHSQASVEAEARAAAELEKLFQLAKRFSFGARRRALRRGSEPAVVADPDQSPLWSVNHYNQASYESADRLARLHQAVEFSLKRERPVKANSKASK